MQISQPPPVPKPNILISLRDCEEKTAETNPVE